jgi:hypothetical protein
MHVEANKDYSFDHNQYLFKYMDLHRLIYFLTTGKLFFSPLSYFDDPLEGISENILYKSGQHLADDAAQSDQHAQKQEEHKHRYVDYLEKVQRTLFASCWFLGTRESLAMWESYSNNDSVALRFHPETLRNLMIAHFSKIEEPDFDAMVHGKVEYFNLAPFDPNDESIRQCGHKYTGFLKDLSYKHEEEFRFLLMQSHETKDYSAYEYCPGKLDELDFTIISHPNMEEWKYNNIYNILRIQNLQDKLKQSEIPTRNRIFETP